MAGLVGWLTGQIRLISRFLNGPKKTQENEKKKKRFGVMGG
jgi:hypothetical protein